MFDLNNFKKKELLELNHRVVERLKEIDVQKTSGFMNEFSLGDKVRFDPPGEDGVSGVVIRKNKKTISVLDDSGHRWNVHPSFLMHQGGGNILDADWEEVV